MTQIKLTSNAEWVEHRGVFWRVHTIDKTTCTLLMHKDPYSLSEQEDKVLIMGDTYYPFGSHYTVRLIATVGSWEGYYEAPYVILDLRYKALPESKPNLLLYGIIIVLAAYILMKVI